MRHEQAVKPLGASSALAREINRRLVLNLLRTRQPISRADLARLSGLQRSTISLIVEELLAEQWLIEGPAVRLPRGRRPTMLSLNDDRAIIGVDIRPTETTIALADLNGEFLSSEVIDTPRDADTAIDAMLERILPLVHSGKKIEGIGISLPGRVDPVTGQLLFAPNLGWKNCNLGERVSQATGLAVELENAANACVLAAVWFDKMEDCRNLLMVLVSEGIGAGIYVNGQLVRGHNGLAGEFGHVSIDPNGPLCTCGGRGCWEVFGSNRAAVAHYRQLRPETGEIKFTDILARADDGDSAAADVLEAMARHLGEGVRMLVAALAPEKIVMIGEITRAWERFGATIETAIQGPLLVGAFAPHLIPLHADGAARLRGTVALVLRKHFGMPGGALA